MKKLIALFAFVASLSFVACNGGGEQTEETVDSTEIKRVEDSIAAAKLAEEEAAAAAAAEMDSTATDSTMMEEGEEHAEGEAHEETTH